MQKITYNTEEAIFLGLFFGFLIITFIFIFEYPSKTIVEHHTTNIKNNLTKNNLTKNNLTKNNLTKNV